MSLDNFSSNKKGTLPSRRSFLKFAGAALLATKLRPDTVLAQESKESAKYIVDPEYKRSGLKILSGLNKGMLDDFMAGDAVTRAGLAQTLRSWSGVPERNMFFFIPVFAPKNSIDTLTKFISDLQLDYKVSILKTDSETLPYTQDMAIPSKHGSNKPKLIVSSGKFSKFRFYNPRDVEALRNGLGQSSNLNTVDIDDAEVPIDGGNTIFTDEHIFIGSNLVSDSFNTLKQFSKENHNEQEYSDYKKTIVAVYERLFGKKAVVLGDNLPQSRFTFHIDLSLVPIGPKKIITLKTDDSNKYEVIRQKVLIKQKRKNDELQIALRHTKKELERLGASGDRSASIATLEAEIAINNDLSRLEQNFAQDIELVEKEIAAHLEYEKAQRKQLQDLGYTLIDLPIETETLLSPPQPTNASVTTNPLTKKLECRFPVSKITLADPEKLNDQQLKKSDLKGAALEMFTILEQNGIVPIPVLTVSEGANGGFHCINNVVE